jgi:hypothetical protein
VEAMGRGTSEMDILLKISSTCRRRKRKNFVIFGGEKEDLHVYLRSISSRAEKIHVLFFYPANAKVGRTLKKCKHGVTELYFQKGGKKSSEVQAVKFFDFCKYEQEGFLG